MRILLIFADIVKMLEFRCCQDARNLLEFNLSHFSESYCNFTFLKSMDSIETLSIYEFHICWKLKQESHVPRISCLSHKNRVHYLFFHLSYISQLHMFLIAAHATKFVNSCTCNYVGYKYSHSIVTKIINFTFSKMGWLHDCSYAVTAYPSCHSTHCTWKAITFQFISEHQTLHT